MSRTFLASLIALSGTVCSAPLYAQPDQGGGEVATPERPPLARDEAQKPLVTPAPVPAQEPEPEAAAPRHRLSWHHAVSSLVAPVLFLAALAKKKDGPSGQGDQALEHTDSVSEDMLTSGQGGAGDPLFEIEKPIPMQRYKQALRMTYYLLGKAEKKLNKACEAYKARYMDEFARNQAKAFGLIAGAHLLLDDIDLLFVHDAPHPVFKTLEESMKAMELAIAQSPPETDYQLPKDLKERVQALKDESIEADTGEAWEYLFNLLIDDAAKKLRVLDGNGAEELFITRSAKAMLHALKDFYEKSDFSERYYRHKWLKKLQKETDKYLEAAGTKKKDIKNALGFKLANVFSTLGFKLRNLFTASPDQAPAS